jgi:diphosphate-dependent phosphofructokinase
VQVSLIETELLLIELVKQELAQRTSQGSYKGKFAPLHHFFGYEGRAGFPSNFDATYCYALGRAAYLLLALGHTGYMASVQNLTLPVEKWQIAGVPLAMLLHLEKRGEKIRPVIAKALVKLEGKAFKQFQKARDSWTLEDHYRFPGPIQFFGPSEIVDSVPLSL